MPTNLTPFMKAGHKTRQLLKEVSNQTQHLLEIAEVDEELAASTQALRLEEAAEKLTLLIRTLPTYSVSPNLYKVERQILADIIPVEIGFTEENWFCVRLPALLPKKESLGTCHYVHQYLYQAMLRFFMGKDINIRFPRCVLIYRHVYSRDRLQRQYRDHDNFEVNRVSDIVTLFTMVDDSPSQCCHYYCSAAGTEERTEVYVVPQEEFTQWLLKSSQIPDEGIELFPEPQNHQNSAE